MFVCIRGQGIFNFLFSRLLCGSDHVLRFKTQIKMWLSPPATFRPCPFHIIQKCTTSIKTELHAVSHASIAFLNKRLCGLKVELCCCWVSSCVLCCGMWYRCVGEMNVLACSYHCWFSGTLNGQCSGAVRMNGRPLSSHDNLLPTDCSNPPPGAIDLALIDSFSPPPPPSSVYHFLSQISLPWPKRSSWKRWQVTTVASNMEAQTERTVTTILDWVSLILINNTGVYKMFNYNSKAWFTIVFGIRLWYHVSTVWVAVMLVTQVD